MENSASSAPELFHTPALSLRNPLELNIQKCYPGQGSTQLEVSTQPGLKLRKLVLQRELVGG